jgi:hypothetical protein
MTNLTTVDWLKEKLIYIHTLLIREEITTQQADEMLNMYIQNGKQMEKEQLLNCANHFSEKLCQQFDVSLPYNVSDELDIYYEQSYIDSTQNMGQQ